MDYWKHIEDGMALIYEVRPDGSGGSRWDMKPGAKGFQDYGYTDEFKSCFVEGIYTQKTATHANRAAYVRLENGELFAIPFPDHIHYDPNQWVLPGFFRPINGWGHFLEMKGALTCTCGAAGWAKKTNQPCPGHGPLCQITQLK